MLDFFSRSTKKQTDPLSNAESARLWVESMVEQHGAGVHARVIDLLRHDNANGAPASSADKLEALLTLNLETQAMHNQICAQYLMNRRMPKVLESRLRGQILAYGKQFQDAYHRFVEAEFDARREERIFALLPLVMARMLHYAGEFARWQFYRHFTPDDIFWLNANLLYQYAEAEKLEMQPVRLFGEHSGSTTVQDQFLILHMLAQLTAGNMNIRQVHFAYELLRLLSTHLLWRREYSPDASFVVILGLGRAARRSAGDLNNDKARYWNTAELMDVLTGWLAGMETGKTPQELRALLEPGIDAALIRALCREWAPTAVRVERAERMPVSDRNLEVAHRFPLLHGLIRKSDKQAVPAQGGAHPADNKFDDISDIRIYGFVTSRRRDRLAALAPGAADVQRKDEFANWSVENVSQTGLGVSLDAHGCEWVGLGHLIGYRDENSSDWSLGLIRRVKNLGRERVFLGIETLSDRPVAASLRQPDGKPIDLSLPPNLSWHGGQIGLFVPTRRAGRNVNALILPLATYTLGRRLYMAARGKHFLIALGKVLEKGPDWCLSEIELVSALEKPPLTER